MVCVLITDDKINNGRVTRFICAGAQVVQEKDGIAVEPLAQRIQDGDAEATQVTVTDGQLSITAAPGARNPTLCWIAIGAEGTAFADDDAQRLADLIEKATAVTWERSAPIVGKRGFVYGTYVDELLSYTNNGTRYFTHSNHLYSPSAVTNAAGQVQERYRYDAYGKQTITTATGTSRNQSAVGFSRGFTGYILDEEPGLYYARARMYSAGLGRFVSRDLSPDLGENVPQAMDGYLDGESLYSGYFIPNNLDPTGLVIKVAMRGAGGILPVAWTGADKVFDSTDVEGAFQYIITRLDTNSDGKVNKADCPDKVRVIGYSWGGWSTLRVADRLNATPIIEDSAFRKLKIGTLDPVGTLRSGSASISGNVEYALNYYQTNGCSGGACAGLPGRLFRGSSVAGAENHNVSNDTAYDAIAQARRAEAVRLLRGRRSIHPMTRFAPDHIDMHDDPAGAGYPVAIHNVFNL